MTSLYYDHRAGLSVVSITVSRQPMHAAHSGSDIHTDKG